MHTIMMTRRAADEYVEQEFFCAETLEEALAAGADHAWWFVDDDGYSWELYLKQEPDD